MQTIQTHPSGPVEHVTLEDVNYYFLEYFTCECELLFLLTAQYYIDECDKRNEGFISQILCYLQTIRSRLAPGAAFTLLGYSFGVVVALEIAKVLEAEGIVNSY